MMGQQGGNQDRLFYSFNLDDHVPRELWAMKSAKSSLERDSRTRVPSSSAHSSVDTRPGGRRSSRQSARSCRPTNTKRPRTRRRRAPLKQCKSGGL
jgi:hypothetical protein